MVIDYDTVLTVEQAVIGSLAIDPQKVAGEVFQRLDPEDFQIPQFRTLFEAARDVFLSGQPLDAVSMADRAGGAGYRETLADAMRMTPSAAHVLHYCDLVKIHSQTSRMREIGEQLSAVMDPEEGRALLAQAEGLLLDKQKVIEWTYLDYMRNLLDRIGKAETPQYLDWGLQRLNKKVRISAGFFCVIGAESSVGKTALALQFARHFAMTGHRVGFFSNETPRQGVGDRLASNGAGVPLEAIKDLQITETELGALWEEGRRAGKMALKIVQTGGWTVERIRAKILADRLDIVFIDYVQQIPWGRRTATRTEVVTNVSMALHEMAQTLGVTIVALSQVTPPDPNNKGQRRLLCKEDLRESKQLAQDGELIMMLDLVDPANRDGMRILIVDKNKDGECGQIYLDFDAKHMRFTQSGDGPPPPSDEDAPPPYKRKYKKRQDRRARYRDEDEEENEDQESMELP